MSTATLSRPVPSFSPAAIAQVIRNRQQNLLVNDVDLAYVMAMREKQQRADELTYVISCDEEAAYTEAAERARKKRERHLHAHCSALKEDLLRRKAAMNRMSVSDYQKLITHMPVVDYLDTRRLRAIDPPSDKEVERRSRCPRPDKIAMRPHSVGHSAAHLMLKRMRSITRSPDLEVYLCVCESLHIGTNYEKKAKRQTERQLKHLVS